MPQPRGPRAGGEPGAHRRVDGAMDLGRVKLTPYGNCAGNSGVLAYAFGPGWILVQFRSGDRYLYDCTCPGPRDVAALQRLATAGRGLSTYISAHVRDHYARKG